MLCTVRMLDGTIESVTLFKRATGRELLEEVCGRLRLKAELDYFGLRYFHEGHAQWINLKNRVSEQLCAGSAVELRVKYFVNHSQLLQAETKRQFFLNVKCNLAAGKYHVAPDKTARVMALLLRCEYGENALMRSSTNQHLLHDWVEHNDARALERLRTEHAQLKGVSSEEAKSLLMTEVEGLVLHGAEMYTAVSGIGENVILAVCRDGIRVYGQGMISIDEYLYSSDLYASVKCKYFSLEIAEDYRCYRVTYKLPNKQMARNLYRATVEFYTFFTEDRVNEWVLSAAKKLRRLSSIASICHSPNAPPKMRYYFDVTKTENEVFGNAWMVVAEEKALELQREIRPSLPPALPRTPKVPAMAFQFNSPPGTPHPPCKSNPLSSRVTKTPKTPGEVFHFGSAPSKMLTANTPKMKEQVFQFSGGPLLYQHCNEVESSSESSEIFEGSEEGGSPYVTPVKETNKTSSLLDNADKAIKTPRTPRILKEIFRSSSTPFKSLIPPKRGLKDVNSPEIRLASGYLTQERLATNHTFNGFLSTISCMNASPAKSDKGPDSAKEFANIANELRNAYAGDREKQTFKNAVLCRICDKKWKNAAFLPCCHVIACIDCALKCRTCKECDSEITRVTRMKYP